MKFPKNQLRQKRHKKIRSIISGNLKRPRLCVFRSNKHIYAQLINDELGKVIAGVSDAKINKKTKGVKRAKETGLLAAKLFIEKGYKNIVFDRGGYKYHGRIKALAEGARSGGLNF